MTDDTTYDGRVGWTCAKCGEFVRYNQVHFHYDDYYQPTSKGWVCPVCGRGIAPWMTYCPFCPEKGHSASSTSDVVEEEVSEQTD